ncbi:helix-turn-helix domain-containing protein (plasmid) [Swingsia samuiensis]|uniref:Helix-turn-helix domain-containing protein n=1 Tax=Swingsia samuiensis TaxID=1293412 RepID=A0A4Y6UKM4_9PROT|nr:helix-turn-helix domain-containing protein [Swingsia samuiensis]
MLSSSSIAWWAGAFAALPTLDSHAQFKITRLSCVGIICSLFRLKVFFEALARFHHISHHQAAVYKALLSFAGKQGCVPSHASLAAEAGVCERTVRNALREARLRGW